MVGFSLCSLGQDNTGVSSQGEENDLYHSCLENGTGSEDPAAHAHHQNVWRV